MGSDFTFGSFYPGDSVLHRLDPRIKLNLMLIMLVAMFVADGFVGLGLGAGFILLAWCMAGVPLKVAWRAVRPVAVFAVMPLVMNVLFTTDGQALLHWRFILITDHGIYLGFFYALRLVLMFASGILLTLTTSSLALAYGIGSLLSPFERFGLPAYEISLMLRIALRFIPDIGSSFNHIRIAQQARGAVFDHGSPLARLRAFLPCLVPLFAQCFRNAENLGLAMESRCYHGGGNRSRYREYHVGLADSLCLTLGLMLLAGVIVLRVLG